MQQPQLQLCFVFCVLLILFPDCGFGFLATRKLDMFLLLPGLSCLPHGM